MRHLRRPAPRPCPPGRSHAQTRVSTRPRCTRRAASRPDGDSPQLDLYAGVPPAGHDDGPTLVPLDDDALGGMHDDGDFPLALLLVGYSDAEAAAVVAAVADDLGAGAILPVLRANEATLAGTLADALTGVSVANAAARSAPPHAGRSATGGLTAAIISGATSDELQAVVGAVTDAGAAPDLWCAAVPANWGDRSVRQLVADIAGDAAAAAARERGEV